MNITQVNVDKGYIYNEFTNPLDEKYTKKQLFTLLMKEYGKPVSKVYIGDNPPIPIGWVFHKRIPYDDCNKYFLAETWVSIEKITLININSF